MLVAPASPAPAPAVPPAWLEEPLVRATYAFQGQSRPVQLPTFATPASIVPLGATLDDAVRAASLLARKPDAGVHEAVAVLQGADGAFHGARLGVNGRPVFVDGPKFSDTVRMLSLGRLQPEVQAVVGGDSWYDMREGWANKPSPLPIA